MADMRQFEIVDDTALPTAQHAVDAERAILGALLVNNDYFADIGSVLKAGHFYASKHIYLYELISRLIDKSHADPVLVAHAARDEGKLFTAGGEEYIADLASIGAAAVNIPAYVQLVVAAAQRRGITKALQEGINEVSRPGDLSSQEIQDRAEARLMTVGEDFTQSGSGPVPIADIANPYCQKMIDMVDSGDFSSLFGTPTGFNTLDHLTHGFHDGDLAIVAGRPGTGKTAFALNLMRTATSDKVGGAALMFSLEMSGKLINMRLLSQYGNDLNKLRSGKDEDGKPINVVGLSSAVGKLAGKAIHIDETKNINIWDIKARTRRLAKQLKETKTPLKLVVIDYLGLVAPTPGGKTNTTKADEIAQITRGLKILAGELGVPVIVLSQLNRAVESRTEKKPFLSDLRDSGAIEQDADLIMFLWKSSQDDDEDVVNLTVSKQRNGQVGEVKLRFEKRYSRFAEIAYEAQDNGEF